MSVEVVDSPQSNTAWLRSLRFWRTFLTLVVLTMLIETGLVVIILTRRMGILLLLVSVTVLHPVTVPSCLSSSGSCHPWQGCSASVGGRCHSSGGATKYKTILCQKPYNRMRGQRCNGLLFCCLIIYRVISLKVSEIGTS